MHQDQLAADSRIELESCAGDIHLSLKEALLDEILLDKVRLSAFTLCGQIHAFEGRDENKPLIVASRSAALRMTYVRVLHLLPRFLVLDTLCSVANLHEIYFLWRPYLPDPQDDMLLELAVSASCRYIVPYNKRDFRGGLALR